MRVGNPPASKPSTHTRVGSEPKKGGEYHALLPIGKSVGDKQSLEEQKLNLAHSKISSGRRGLTRKDPSKLQLKEKRSGSINQSIAILQNTLDHKNRIKLDHGETDPARSTAQDLRRHHTISMQVYMLISNLFVSAFPYLGITAMITAESAT